MTPDRMWDILRDVFGVSEETLQVVANGWGHNRETYETVLFAVAGERSFDQQGDDDE